MSNSTKSSEAGRVKDFAPRAEHQLLLCCARVNPTEETLRRASALLNSVTDWELLLKLARRHSVLPLLYFNLKKLDDQPGEGLVKLRFLRRLKEEYGFNAARNLFLTSELSRIVHRFNEAGVPLVAYKGPALAVMAYGDPTLRRYVDLDVLVRREDVPRAKRLLSSLGLDPLLQLSGAQEELLLSSQHNLQFGREGGRVLVELHWEMAAPGFASSFRAQDFWGRLVTVKLNGFEASCHSPEVLLLSLCVHGAKHYWERLGWTCDVAGLIERWPDLDWFQLLREAERTGTERMLFLGLSLASDLSGANLPAEISEKVNADPSVLRLAAQVSKRLFEPEEFAPLSLREGAAFNLRARRRWGDKARYLGFMFTPTDGDLSLASFPPGLKVLYYFVRPFRLLLRGANAN